MAKSLDMASPFKGIVFNKSDREDKPELEVWKSVEFTPENATGEFRTVPFNYYERRGALNAMGRLLFAGDTFTEDMHLYNRRNPDRLGGQLGWIKADRFMPRNGTNLLQYTFMVEGILYFAALPYRKNDQGVAVVNIFTPWLRMEGLAGNRITLTNAPAERDHPNVFPGVILHSYMDEIRSGVRLTVPTTFDTLWGRMEADGSQSISDTIHDNAVRLWELVELGKAKGFEVAQALYWENKSALAGARDLAKAEEKFQAKNEAKPEGERTENPGDVLMVTVKFLNGEIKSVKVNEVPDGNYDVVYYANGKPTTRAFGRGKVKVYPANRTALNPIARDPNLGLIQKTGE